MAFSFLGQYARVIIKLAARYAAVFSRRLKDITSVIKLCNVKAIFLISDFNNIF